MSSEVLTERAASRSVVRFVDEVGVTEPVRVVGSASHLNAGRRSNDDLRVRDVAAPSGVVEVQAAELIVRVGAGTSVAELDVALAEARLQCPLDPRQGTRTVGGVLAVGHSGVRRLRHGHVRDLVLETLYVSADGVLRRSGAPVVKNVTGYDITRLFVGSLGTLALMGEVVLRCQPMPEARLWLNAEVDPWSVRRSLFRPSSILWDGTRTYVQLEGPVAEVSVERAALPGSGWTECAAPALSPVRGAVGPSELKRLMHEAPSSVFGAAPDDSWMVEIGVGTVHGAVPSVSSLPAPVLELNRKVKDAFDPTGRLNPGVLPW